MKNIDTTTLFLGQKLFIRDRNYLLTELKKNLKSSEELKIIFTPNSEQLVLAKNDPIFANNLGEADYLIPDGVGLVLGSKILSIFKVTQPVSQRIAGVDLVNDLLVLAKNLGLKVLIIGGRNYDSLLVARWKIKSVDIKNLAKKSVKSKNSTTTTSNSQILWHEGFLNVSIPLEREQKLLTEIIANLKPDIVFVCFGAPYQEQWLIDNKELLQRSGVKISMVAGGAFDMLLGKVARAPKWVRKIGLEWLYRLYKEPWRWRRQLSLLTFIKMVFREIFS